MLQSVLPWLSLTFTTFADPGPILSDSTPSDERA